MIKANEIRIGNYVKKTLEGEEIVKILQIREMEDRKTGNMSISYTLKDGGYSTTSLEENEYFEDKDEYIIQPIPLTEEILTKIGLNTEDPILTFLGMEAYLVIQEFSPNKGLLFCKGIMPYQVLKCDYLHELQNIYFTITNTELPIKDI